MKKLNYGKNTITALLAVVTLLFIGLGCGAEKPEKPPTDAEAQALVKATMSDFANAVDKGDFAAFRANTAKEFQTQYTDDQMKTQFKSFTDQKAAVMPILRDAASKNITFSPAQSVKDENGYSVLVANGTIDSDPQAVAVTNEYVYQDSKWKLLKIGLQLK